MRKTVTVDVELPEYLDNDSELAYLLSCLTDSEVSALKSYAKDFIKGMLFTKYPPEQLAAIEAAAKNAQ